MKIETPEEVESLCYQMRLSDYTRGLNRAMIDDLFNGAPPYDDQEVAANNIAVNVNFLEGTSIAHDARSQFYGAMLKPGEFFTASTDCGPSDKRDEWGRVVTREVNRIMKRSLPYFECMRSKFALNVLHGIGPAAFKNRTLWCPEPIGICDVMVPANTLLTMENVPFIAIYKTFTAAQLIRLTSGPNVDPAWNRPMVEECLVWLDGETMKMMGNNWPEVWSPERANERVKGSGAVYAGDMVPTINVWDFYYWDDADDRAGWRRRMVLDNWSMPEMGGAGKPISTRRTGKPFDSGKNQFMYDPGDRIYAENLQQIVNFQFADLSAVAPFRYHSVRSLGFLLYSTLHLQNRLRCRFSESVFETLMMYFRVKGSDDAQRALKVELVNRGMIDESVEFVRPDERHQPNWNMVALELRENAFLINRHSSSYTADPARLNQDIEKTKFQVQSELSAMTNLVSAGLMQAYQYQEFEYQEIFRRFCIHDSNDSDVREFQARCAKHGVPLNMLDDNLWNLVPERVLGAGNKAMELTIAQQLMQYRNLYDPGAQRTILRDFTMSLTDDPGKSRALVRDEKSVSNSTYDAQLMFGTLMQGIPVVIPDGVNHIEVAESLIDSMAIVVQRVSSNGGLPDYGELIGLVSVGQQVGQVIGFIAQDPSEGDRVRAYSEALGNLMNQVKAFGQRFAEQQQAQGQAGGEGQDDTLAKAQSQIQAEMLKTEAKIKNQSQAHAQRTAQREVQFESQMKQKQEQHAQDMQMREQEMSLDFSRQKNDAELEFEKKMADIAIQEQSAKAKSKQQKKE